MLQASQPHDADLPDSEGSLELPDEPREPQGEESLDRRTFLGLAGKWSKAVVAAVVAGVVMAGGAQEAEAGGSWANRRGGGGWANRR